MRKISFFYVKTNEMEQTQVSLQDQLLTDCRAFVDWTDGLSDEQFITQINGKWSVAEVMQHLYLSARPAARLMAGPREVLTQWGQPETPSRSYSEIASAYQGILATGIKAPDSMSPRADDMQADRSDVTERFTGIYEALVSASETWSAQELDAYCIPHPVLGRLTVREMLYFVSIHTQHHLRLLLLTRYDIIS